MKQIIVILSCLATLASLSTPSLAEESESSETGNFVKTCLKDYLVNFEKADGGSAARAEFDKIKERCLSSKFRASWAKIVKASDADPLTKSQDVAELWKKQIQIRDLNLVEGSVKVVLGKGKEAQCLQLGLKGRSANRRIDSSKLCSKN